MGEVINLFRKDNEAKELLQSLADRDDITQVVIILTTDEEVNPSEIYVSKQTIKDIVMCSKQLEAVTNLLAETTINDIMET